jgi:hypothetical protein
MLRVNGIAKPCATLSCRYTKSHLRFAAMKSWNRTRNRSCNMQPRREEKQSLKSQPNKICTSPNTSSSCKQKATISHFAMTHCATTTTTWLFVALFKNPQINGFRGSCLIQVSCCRPSSILDLANMLFFHLINWVITFCSLSSYWKDSDRIKFVPDMQCYYVAVALHFVLFHFVPGHFVPVISSPHTFCPQSFRPRSFRPLVISSPSHFVP